MDLVNVERDGKQTDLVKVYGTTNSKTGRFIVMSWICCVSLNQILSMSREMENEQILLRFIGATNSKTGCCIVTSWICHIKRETFVNQHRRTIQSALRVMYPIRSESCLEIKFVSKLYYSRLLGAFKVATYWSLKLLLILYLFAFACQMCNK